MFAKTVFQTTRFRRLYRPFREQVRSHGLRPESEADLYITLSAEHGYDGVPEIPYRFSSSALGMPFMTLRVTLTRKKINCPQHPALLQRSNPSSWPPCFSARPVHAVFRRR
ncbi:hypothetical protein BUE60_06280 [Pseudomonas syringae pv. actinidiae]|nr:hypothetical protein B1R35_28470 [Pseudomonas syringae pv. actinidiae]AQX67480.1 hypothetical protein B1F85_28510 [Pseudomonas syringae pv. actinidiae]PBK55691.1 hypothetical protein BUE60_06280 [Pseudomonas syringae pv. actinidiae]PBK56573.1 hypothetical protein BUE61_05095 [Pseudomonas syringae pv. actinidiae]